MKYSYTLYLWQRDYLTREIVKNRGYIEDMVAERLFDPTHAAFCAAAIRYYKSEIDRIFRELVELAKRKDDYEPKSVSAQ